MRKPHKIVNSEDRDDHMAFRGFEVVCKLGDYDLLLKGYVEYDETRWAVVCPPELRKPGYWNISELHIDRDGNITFVDTDVEPDPYHMCLIYQAIEAYEKGATP